MKSKPRHAPKERPPDPRAAGTPWRLFISIPIPPAAQALITSITSTLDDGKSGVRWTASGSEHLTLHFLGDTDPSQAELLRLSFSTAAGKQPAFDLRTGGLGCFPDEGPPKVVWLGLGGQTRELSAFQHALGERLRKLSLESEDRSFRPHITLGRVRDDAKTAEGQSLRARTLDPGLNERLFAETTPIPVQQIQLVRSYLERSGARHDVIATANLRPAESLV